MENGKLTVDASIGSQPYLTTIKWENGEILSDEPIDKGGRGLHPDPFSLLSASLASCTLITLRMYIDRKGWNIDTIKVNITINQHKEGIQTHTSIIKNFEFHPEITEEQRDRLHLIADKCPIAKTLAGQIEIITV